MSKSQQIRELYNQGNNIGEIAQKMNIRYQFAYNVVSRECSKTGEPVRRRTEITTSQQIRELFKAGNTVGSIAKQLNTNYTFVHQVVSKYRNSLTSETAEQAN